MAKTPNPAGRDVYVPTMSFTARVDGLEVTFVEGETSVREGHPILDVYGHLFQPIRVRYDVEQATAAPGELRG